MRLTIRTLSLSAALLAGCETSATAPVHRAAAAAGRQLVIINPVQSWTVVSLPFRPTAINDAGVIVGSKAGEAVRWQNGVLTTLPHRAWLPGPYSAVDITPNGVILGVGAANQSGWGHGLYWSSPTAAPVDISGSATVLGMPSQPAPIIVRPVAMNDSYVIVGTMSTTTTPLAVFKWTPSTGIRTISGSSTSVVANGLNASGYVAGTQQFGGGSSIPVLWDPSGNLTQLYAPSAPHIGPIGQAAAINDAGDVVGSVSMDGQTFVTRFWYLNGSYNDVSVANNFPVKISNSGRIIDGDAWTYFAGVLTKLTVPSGEYVRLVGLNTCGWIIGQGSAADTGYLWVRTNGCDTSNPTPSLPLT